MAKEKVYKLSHQSIGAFMLALQKCLAEEIDIVEILSEFELKETEEGLIVLNPPTVTIPEPKDA